MYLIWVLLLLTIYFEICIASPLGEAVDNTSLSWATGGDANCFDETTTSYYGGDAAQSGEIGHDQIAWVETTVTATEPAQIRFYWKVSSEEGYDFLRFYIDGNEQDGSISGEVDWQQKTYNIPLGTHTLRWTYTKDFVASVGSDCGWLDKVEIVLSKSIVDFDGDWKNDITIWRPGDGYWYIIGSKDGVIQTQWGLGALNDFPVPGDYDGDGKTDVAVWRPGDGYWYIIRSSDGGITQTQWGTGTLFPEPDIPVPGDSDGDGKTDIAVWRPLNGYWYIKRSSDQGVTQTQWGTGTLFAEPDIPVPGDYDGDGKTDIAIYRPFDGYWHILRSSDQGVKSISWGTPADEPISQ